MTSLGTDEPAKWHVHMFSSLPHKSGNVVVVAVADAKLSHAYFDSICRIMITSQERVSTRGLENSGSGK